MAPCHYSVRGFSIGEWVVPAFSALKRDLDKDGQNYWRTPTRLPPLIQERQQRKDALSQPDI